MEMSALAEGRFGQGENTEVGSLCFMRCRVGFVFAESVLTCQARMGKIQAGQRRLHIPSHSSSTRKGSAVPERLRSHKTLDPGLRRSRNVLFLTPYAPISHRCGQADLSFSGTPPTCERLACGTSGLPEDTIVAGGRTLLAVFGFTA